MIYFATATGFFGQIHRKCCVSWQSVVLCLNPHMFVPEKYYKWYGSTFVLEVKMHISPEVARKSCETALLKIAKKEGKF